MSGAPIRTRLVRLAAARRAWQKFYMPTLMQALKDESLRTQMRLIVNHGMREALRAGRRCAVIS